MVPFQGDTEVGRGVFGLENRENAGVLDGVWVRCTNQLEGHLETPAPFVATNLHPDLIVWDDSIMPCKPLDTGRADR